MAEEEQGVRGRAVTTHIEERAAVQGEGAWTVASSDPSIVSVLKIGDKIKVTGVSLGKAAIMVTSQSRLRCSVPVRVYDTTVLDAGEILIKYIDTFKCLPQMNIFDGSSYRPVVPEGWHALGSFAVPPSGCPNINGLQWMIVVKENSEHADPTAPPLLAPTDMRRISGYGHNPPIVFDQEFWIPRCPAGYVAMGIVATAAFAFNAPEPSLDDAVCVRQALTVPGVPGGNIVYYYSDRIGAPDNSNHESTTVYLETGAFHHQDHKEVRNVLAVDLPALIDVRSPSVRPFQRQTPRRRPGS
jgi:hypothetical protein